MSRIDVWINGIDAPLWVRHFRIHEALSSPFEVALVVVSPEADLDIDAAAEAPAGLSLIAGWAYVFGGGARRFTGIVNAIEQIAVEPSGLSTYEIQIVPRLFLLTQNRDYRIFQRQTVPGIVKRVLDDCLIEHEWRLDIAGFPSLEYRVQYGESDFAFLSRLCEEAGISFFFEHRDGASMLVFSDDPATAPLRSGQPLPFEFAPNQSIEGDHDKEWIARCRAVWTDAPYKPTQKTPKPKIEGLQSAIVQGPREREIFTDEHGRIKVRFFWDREARDADQTSCWMRVSQAWTGPGFGIWAIPRVGQEVLVGFLEGNPDEPIVMGHIPNALTPPPYTLPTNQTKTVIRTHSTGGGDGHNEISFEDQKGEELFFTRAEKDRENLVRGDDRELVGGNAHRLVKGDEHTTIKGDRFDEVRGDVHEGIDGDAKAKVGGSVSLGVGGDLSVDIGGTFSVRVGGQVFLVALDKLLIAASDASMQSGGGFVRATPGAVFVSPLVENAGISGSGMPNAPAMPAPPIMPAAYQPHLPTGPRRLPLLGWVGGIPAVGAMTDEEVICWGICSCKDAKGADGDAARQLCYIRKIRLYEQAARGTTHIWSEVPYDMNQAPPVPIMSRKEPWRATGRKPKGSRIPDNILVKDPNLPPTVDNIDRIIEIKFEGDGWSRGQKEAYEAIGRAAGGVKPELWSEEYPCYCADKEKEKVPEPVKIKQEDAVAAAILAAAIIVLLLDDAAGGFADDAAIPPLIIELGKRLAGLGLTFP